MMGAAPLLSASWINTVALGGLWPTTLFVFGLMIGSFLNVFGLRLLSEESIVFPPSHCPKCQSRIRWFDNIPVISWLALGGQCRDCKTAISIQYPLIELLTAWLFVGVGVLTGFSGITLLLLFLVINLVVITITDWRESVIYEINSLPLIPAGLILNLWYPAFIGPFQYLPLQALTIGPLTVPESVFSSLLGIALGFAFFEGAILLSKVAFKTDGFGHGDTQLMMGVGAFLGVEYTALALMLGFVMQTVWAVPLLVLQWVKNRQYISLGSGAGALTFACLPMFFITDQLPLEQQEWLLWGCMAAAIVCLLVFLKQMRDQENYTYVPLGPALVAGTLVSLFLKLTQANPA